MLGYPIDSQSLDREIFILAALVAGQTPIAQGEEGRRGLRMLEKVFGPSEVSMRLVSLAVHLRQRIDANRSKAEEEVGVWTPDIAKLEHKQPITLREACNKIIHADDVDYIHQIEGYPRMVRIAGRHGKKEWEADVNLLTFLEAATNHEAV